MMLYASFAILTSSRRTRSQDTPSSTSAYVIVGTGDPIPTATGPVCTQLRQPIDLPATSISQTFASASAVPNACNISLQQRATDGLKTIIYYAYRGYMFNISRPTAAQRDEVISPDLCPNTFNQIITSCIGDTAPLYWGGFWSTGVTNYSVTNNESPPIPLRT